MNRFLLIIFLSCVLMACRTTNVEKVDSESKSASKVETCELLVKFSSDESLKRLMVKLDNLRLEIVKEVSASNHIHRVKLNCKTDDIEGLIFKLNQQEGVEWVSLAD
jgi:hypothetical protein